MNFDWLVVGAGLTGATLAERLADAGQQRVLVIDRRPHLAGNAFDCRHQSGVMMHNYGVHIFHTTSARVWAYLSQFTTWRPYEHRVLGSVDGQLVPVPFNLRTLRALLPPAKASELEGILIDTAGWDGRIPVLRLLEHEDTRLRELGELVWDKIFAGYSSKQWGMRPEDLDRSVTGRVPILVSEDDRYFQDPYQGIPTDGYTAMVARMLDHPNIEVELGTELSAVRRRVTFDRMVYTGPLDELFDYRFGPLPYRSLRFEHRRYNTEFKQAAGQINYPNDHDYTRTLEHKHLTGQKHRYTVVTTEWPEAYEPGRNEPYYPVPAADTRAHYQRYRDLAEANSPGMILAGRLADYRYYNMDQAVNRALTLFRHRIMGAAPAAESAA